MRVAFVQMGPHIHTINHDGEYVGQIVKTVDSNGGEYYSVQPSEYEEGEYRAHDLTTAQYIAIGWCTSELEG